MSSREEYEELVGLVAMEMFKKTKDKEYLGIAKKCLSKSEFEKILKAIK
ncbi:MAG: hypothetical protein ACTSX0_13845 [Promethearchaeota archaeon]